MSQKERDAASLEQITSLCFQISGLVVEDEEKKAVSTFPMCISSSKSQLTATSPPFVPKEKEKVGVSDSASILVTPVCSGYIGALTNLSLLFLLKLRRHLLDHRVSLLLCNMSILLLHLLRHGMLLPMIMPEWRLSRLLLPMALLV
jgi:hypothetical protein